MAPIRSKLGVGSRRELGQALATRAAYQGPGYRARAVNRRAGPPGRVKVDADRQTTVRSAQIKIISAERHVVSVPRQGDAAHGVPGHHDYPRSGSNPGYDGLGDRLPPLGRAGQVADVVDGILFLESSPYITGEVLHVDGGQTAGH
jgi:hypothetical protein